MSVTSLSPWRVAWVLALALASCERPRPDNRVPGAPPLPPMAAAPAISAACAEPAAFWPMARVNAGSLNGLVWEPFRREEIGWEIYAPAVAREIGTSCPPHSPGFAAALARWQQSRGLPGDGMFNGVAFNVVKGLWQERRPFVMATLDKQCPDAPDELSLEPATPQEGYAGKPIMLRPAALAAYRRMRDAARAEVPQAAADPQLLSIFSGFRSPAADEARCILEGNCQGVTRARCSAHRTGLAMDLNLGAAPGLRPDSAADENRLYMSRTATYRWLVANADRFGFANYVFEPWHWEWTGEALLPQTSAPGTIPPPQPLSSQETPVEPPDEPANPHPQRIAADPGGRLQSGGAARPAGKTGADSDRGALRGAAAPDAAPRRHGGV